MRSASIPLLVVLGATLMIAPMGLGQAPIPDTGANPVVNGDFELSIPDEATAPLEGTPADECVGVGHQVFYGTETYQHDLIDENDPGAAAERDPGQQAELLSGYGHCVFSDEQGYDLAWINPVNTASDDAVQWSGHNDDTVTDVDGDGDREIQVDPATAESSHSFWQAYPNAFQAFTGNFDALEFDVEDGQIPDRAFVQVSLSATPLHTQTEDLVIYRDCALTFKNLDDAVQNGHVAIDPVDAQFSDTGDADCEDLEDAWNDPSTTDDDRRTMLGQLRIVQLSFWRLNAGTDAVVIDNVSLTGSSTVVEEIAAGNVNVAPSPPSPDDV